MDTDKILDILTVEDLANKNTMTDAAMASNLWINCMLELIARNPKSFMEPKEFALLFIKQHLQAVACMEELENKHEEEAYNAVYGE